MQWIDRNCFGETQVRLLQTYNPRDFQNARESLGLQVMTPTELVIKLAVEGI